jgi:general secretion pathway protein E
MITFSSQSPVDFVDLILESATAEKASDIYFLPGDAKCEIRLRTKGVQKPFTEMPIEEGLQAINRVKVLAGMLTYKTQTAQDGAFEFNDTSFRCASMPTSNGERLTLRILNQIDSPQVIDDLGFSSKVTQCLNDMLLPEQGLILLTGATGSGKTTTMYAMIRELLKNNQDPASIISLEDPIESNLAEISQTAVNKTENWGYNEALKAALRQDVKTLLIGELRDKEIVKTALDAALSGHRIISTFHAGNIPSIYARLLHYGFEPFLIATAVTGCVSMQLTYDDEINSYKPTAECLVIDDDWRDLVMSKPSLKDMRSLAEKLSIK